MTRSEAASHSIAEAQRDRESHSLPGSGAGPNKAGALDGASAFGSELGAVRDARRDLARARAEGDNVPAPPSGSDAASLGFGMLNGADQGITTPGKEKRSQLQAERNDQIHSHQPDLAQIARASAGAPSNTRGAENPTSSGTSNPDALLNTVATSTGTESGTGADKAGIQVTRDAPTSA